MSVTIVSNGTKYVVPKANAMNSKHIEDLITGFDDEVEITIPDKYHKDDTCGCASKVYIAFLQDDKSVTISDIWVLKDCFDLESYMEDKHYLNFLIDALIDNWQELSKVFDILHPDIRQEVLLIYPFDLIPIEYLVKDESFIKLWCNVNNGKNIIMGKEEKRTYKVDVSYRNGYIVSIKLSCYIDTAKTCIMYDMYENTNKFMKQTYTIQYSSHCQERLTGRYRSWYKNSVLECDCYYDNNKKTGPHKYYYDNGQIAQECYYIDGKIEGVNEVYYDTGQLHKRYTYDNDRRHGKYTGYFLAGEMVFEGSYNLDELHGPHKSWYTISEAGKEGVLRTESEYKYGKKHGVCKTYSVDGELQSELIYDEGNVIGPDIVQRAIKFFTGSYTQWK
jgi:antitoxin component YwqK of YwqJK toxin-antitoxin module